MHEIGLVTHGGGRLRLGDEEHLLRAGSLTVRVPGEAGGLELAPGARIALSFARSALLAPLQPIRRGFHAGLSGPESQWLLGRLSAVELELARAEEASGAIVAALLAEILCWLVRLREGIAPSPGRGALDRRAAALLTAVEGRFRTCHRVGDLAGALDISPSRLTEWCRQQCGMTPKELLQRRLRFEAEKLLASTDAKVAEISRVLGFADASYFSRFFRRQLGVSPSGYRRRLRRSRRAG